jgi:hypothetical protein
MPQLRGRCIGGDKQRDFLPRGRRVEEGMFSTSEVVDLPALADLKFIFNGAIRPMPFGGFAEIIS